MQTQTNNAAQLFVNFYCDFTWNLFFYSWQDRDRVCLFPQIEL